jgi:hypothetical protein
MTNEKLKEIQERLLEKSNGHRDAAIKEVDAHARGYLLGVNDALAAVSFTRPEQQNQPASETRTNLDRIRAMSAEEIANWVEENLECCSCPISDSQGRSCETNCTATFINWLNSSVKENTE